MTVREKTAVLGSAGSRFRTAKSAPFRLFSRSRAVKTGSPKRSQIGWLSDDMLLAAITFVAVSIAVIAMVLLLHSWIALVQEGASILRFNPIFYRGEVVRDADR